MRQARSTKAVRTIPKGAYECGTTSDELMNGDYRDSLHRDWICRATAITAAVNQQGLTLLP